MIRLKNMCGCVHSVLLIHYKKVVAVFGPITGILSFVSIFNIICFNIWWFICSVCLGAIIIMIWLIIESKTRERIRIKRKDRLGTIRSLSEQYSDNLHRFTHITRQDLLDYKTMTDKLGGHFVSFRVLEGYNDSNTTTDGITYLECSEYKSYPKDIKIAAYDATTGNQLRVEFLGLSDNEKYFEFPFKIFFANLLQPLVSFHIAFSIILTNELEVLKDDDEIMSISLLRYKKGVEKLDFNVCLNFSPASVHIEYKKQIENDMFDIFGNAASVEKYTPATKWEQQFDIEWTAEPYIIKWGCNKPQWKLYAINYKK